MLSLNLKGEIMLNKKIGFIGAGNMAKAMIGGIVKSKLVESNYVFASDLNTQTLEDVKSIYGINTTKDSKEVVKNSDIVVVAVKPNVYELVLEEVKEMIDEVKEIKEEKENENKNGNKNKQF